MVVVCARNYEPNVYSIAQTLEAEPCYSEDGCWYALRAWHRARRFGITEAPAERWASCLHFLWNPVQGHMTGTLIDRLHLKAIGFRGTGPDDLIVDKVVDALKGSPYWSEQWKRMQFAR